MGEKKILGRKSREKFFFTKLEKNGKLEKKVKQKLFLESREKIYYLTFKKCQVNKINLDDFNLSSI